MRKTLTKIFLPVFAVGLSGQIAYAAPADGANDPGAQLERSREEMERLRIAEQIEEDEQNRNAKVERSDEKNPDEETASVTFELKKINFDESQILLPEELETISSEYVGKEISLNDLYKIVEEVNKLYVEKGFMTCRAFLPPQTIHEGEVQIRLVEGKTGKVTVTGNKHTRENYILKSFPLAPGEIANTQKLNKNLQRFNGTEDVQLRITMKAGENFGETDYEIIAYEPKNQALTLYVDNGGYETSGKWREGIFYNYRSLTGRRDSFRANYIRSTGTDAWGVGFSIPLNHRGMKLDLDYNTNETEIKSGELVALGVEGKAKSIGATLRVPFHADQKSRYETGLQVSHQKSQTDLGMRQGQRVRWVDDKTTRITPYATFIHYGKNRVFYHKHSFVISRRENISGVSATAPIYRLNGLWQKRYGGGQIFKTRFDGQITSKDILGSSDRFFIGGANSVRGYEESFLGGEKGFTASIEYQIPVTKNKRLNVFPFIDYGHVSGGSVYDEKSLTGGGIGFNLTAKYYSASLAWAVPFKKTFAGKKVDSSRLHLTVTGNF